MPISLRLKVLCINLITLIEFRPKNCRSNSDTPDDAEAACDHLLEMNDVERGEGLTYIAVLLALFLGFRLTGAFALMKKAETFY